MNSYYLLAFCRCFSFLACSSFLHPDRYKHLDRRNPEAHNHKRPEAVLLNFASSTNPLARFLYIMDVLLTHLAQYPAKRLPVWLLLDYTLTMDLTASSSSARKNPASHTPL